MPTTQAQTWKQIRTQIGESLEARFVSAATNGSTTTFLTDNLFGGTDDYNGWWWLGTDAPNDGVLSRIVDTSVSSNRTTLTLYPAVTSTVSADTAELWPPHLHPTTVQRIANQSILHSTGKVFDPDEDITLHTGGRRRWDIPTDLEMVNDLQLRVAMTSTTIISGGVVWDESIDSNFTVAEDSDDLLFGKSATRFTIDSGVSNGDLASDSITSLNVSDYTHIEFPIKVRDTVVASDFILRLSATANGAETNKLIAIPGLTSNTETWVRVAMTDNFSPSAATAIISVALEMNANAGDNIVWLGSIEATDAFSYQWESMSRNLWEIDKEARELVFVNGGQNVAEYRLIKLKGGDNPLLFSSDSDVTEVPEDYIISRSIAQLLQRPIRGESTEEARIRQSNAASYFAIAEREQRNFPMLKNARFVT